MFDLKVKVFDENHHFLFLSFENLKFEISSRNLITTEVTSVCQDGYQQGFEVSSEFECGLQEYPTCHGELVS